MPLPWAPGQWRPPYIEAFLNKYTPRRSVVDDTSKGTYAAVVPCVRKSDGASFAVRAPLAPVRDSRVAEGWQSFGKATKLLKDAPHVCLPFDFFCGHTGAAFVMPLRKLGDLHTWAMAYSPMDPNEVALVGSQICAALAAVHALPAAHCDVKPENILVSRASGGRLLEVELCDWDALLLAATPTSLVRREERGSEPYYVLLEHELYRLRPLEQIQRQDLRALATTLMFILNRVSFYKMPDDPGLAAILTAMRDGRLSAADAKQRFDWWLLDHQLDGGVPRNLDRDHPDRRDGVGDVDPSSAVRALSEQLESRAVSDAAGSPLERRGSG